jgi:uncharacterized alpha-E superfamily protein
MYRKSQHYITPSGVAEFLILDRQFPRSIHFCLWQTQQRLHEITQTPPGSWCNGAERALGKLCSRLSYLTIEDIIQSGLHEFLNDMQNSINEVGKEIYTTFIALSDSFCAIPNKPSNDLQLSSASNTQASSAEIASPQRSL